ncbi:hypothetical protein [Streptomyces sp. NPDC007346]|uniref:hypothetical protein n=1 Tax=Streptomyces sp. NPDC007346 TaxID=3154682 RepID=UPI00345655E3
MADEAAAERPSEPAPQKPNNARSAEAPRGKGERGGARDRERGGSRDRERGGDRDRERGDAQGGERGGGRDRERGDGRDRERGGDRDDEKATGSDSADGSRPDSDSDSGSDSGSGSGSGSADDEAAEREKERERAADRFKGLTRDPLADEQGEDAPTDLAAAARARRAGQKLHISGRDLTSFDRTSIGQAHIGDINVSLDARRSGAAMRGGPVPEEELRRLRRDHVAPDGYVRLRRALQSRRLLVLGGAPGTGRTCTALALLDEVTREGAGGGDRVRRVDPGGGEGVRGLADEVAGEVAGGRAGGAGGRGGDGGGGAAEGAGGRAGEVAGGGGGGAGDGAGDAGDRAAGGSGDGAAGGIGERRGTGYLLELALDRPGTLPPDEMDLDRLASVLAERGAYAVVVVSVGSAANPMLAGRYGMICPPAPTRELVTTRLRERLEEEYSNAGGEEGARTPGTSGEARTPGSGEGAHTPGSGDGARAPGTSDGARAPRTSEGARTPARTEEPRPPERAEGADADRGARGAGETRHASGAGETGHARRAGETRHAGRAEGTGHAGGAGVPGRTEGARTTGDAGGGPGPDRADELSRLLDRAARLSEDPDVTEAVGLTDLRPAEAELLASLLAEHVLGNLTREELLSGCRSLAAVQAYEWFAGVDRALAAPPALPAPAAAGDGRTRASTRSGTAALFHPVAFRIALAVLGGASHSAVSTAAHLLTWELSVQSDPDSTPSRPLFCDDPEADLALSRARSEDGVLDVAGAEVAGQLIFYRGSALPAAVLAEVWDRHFPVRAPVVRWLRLLADDPRPDVSVRAAVAAGELSVRDFEHGFTELVRPLAETPSYRRRVFAATALDQVAGHASHRKAVRKLVEDWSRYGTASLRWTAAMALGYGRAADSMDDTLDALARIGVHDSGEQLAVASLNVVRLLTLHQNDVVLSRLRAWTEHRGEEYQDLALVAIVRLALTDVDDVLDDEPGTPLGDRGDWPLLLALVATRPELTGRLADLFWTALNTARSQDVALDALESMLRSASRKNGSDWTRPGLAALLPALTAEEHDRRRLDWLLRRMMRDQDRPLTAEQASALWWLAVPARQRRSDEEGSHG